MPPVSPPEATAFGPLEGDLIGCEYDTRRLIRMSLERVGDTFQGACYPFTQEPLALEEGLVGPLVCAVSPTGNLYVGSIRDSGWGAGNNHGEIVQIKIQPEKLPCGIRHIRCTPQGFTLDFFRPIDATKASQIASYSIQSYRRVATAAYGGPDLEKRAETITAVTLSEDARQVRLTLADPRLGYQYEFRLKNLAPANQPFFPAEAFYTRNAIPGGAK